MNINKSINKSSLKRFEKVMIVACVISLLVAGPVVARLSSNTIDPIVTLSSNNRQVLVTGPIDCTKGEKLSLDVILTQRDTSALAKGKLETTCTGDIQKWKINTKAEYGTKLKEGTATAWALATTRNHGKITDVDQWSREVKVVK